MQGTALVKEVTEGRVRLSWNTWQEPLAPAPITLLLAMPRPKVLRRLWATLAELGVAEVIVTHAAKVEKGYGNSKALQTTAILSELRTGLEQAGETVLPNVLYSNSMANAIAYIATAEASPRWSQARCSFCAAVLRLL